MAYLWPGLSLLWPHGSWLGFALAVGMAAIFDVLLLASFGWDELVGHDLRMVLWAAFAGAWAAALAWSIHRSRRERAARCADVKEDGFGEAVGCYLQGDYYEAEQILQTLVRRNDRDLDARLLLATLWRRSGRFEEATRQLDLMVRFEGAEKWELEIQDERERLAEAQAATATAA